MKKILLFSLPIFLIFSAVSCNDRLEGDEILNTESLKIDSVKIPQYSMDVLTTQTITTYSNYTSKCEGFYGYDYLHTDEFDRQVVSYKFKTNANCGEILTKASQINFRPQKAGTYHFKFYNGKDASNNDVYIEEIIEVN